MLRPYQTDLIDKARQAYRDGYKSPCIVLPCGGGKSVIVAEIAKNATLKGNRVLFLVHRQELCEQIQATFTDWGVNMNLCDICMVQTASKHLDEMPAPQLIITDENHHAKAKTYRKIYDFFPKAKRLGVTATPIRLDGSGLIDVNDCLVVGVTAKWLIDNNFLAGYKYYAPEIADLSGIKSYRGEYSATDIEGCMMHPKIYGDVIGHYIKLADGKQAICYCATVRHSTEMARAFTRAGISAVHIDGTTPKNERSELIERFRRGEIKILCNVDLISEGFDVPDCEAVILLRPTKSLTLYIQQSMRCMRYKQGKTAIIIDHVGNYLRHGLPDTPREWSLEGRPKKKKNIELEMPDESLKKCPKCGTVFELLQDDKVVCPKCGHRFGRKVKPLQEVKSTELKQITSFKLGLSRPEDCKSMAELYEYARKKGYKLGWAYYKGKEFGFI